MRSTVTLYEFMPYGAPELLESRQRHMSRALALTSVAAILASVLAGGLASLVHVALPAQPPVLVDTGVIVIPPPLVEHPAVIVPPKVPTAPTAPKVAVPVPVPDVVAPPSETPAATPSVAVADGPSGPSTVGDVVATGATEVLPPFGTWVYVEQLPAPVKEVKPEYPQIARDAHVEGPVTVHVLIGKDGRVVDVRLDKKIQVPMLNQAALDAARKWVFTPGYANGHPVACWTVIPYRFVLN